MNPVLDRQEKKATRRNPSPIEQSTGQEGPLGGPAVENQAQSSQNTEACASHHQNTHKGIPQRTRSTYPIGPLHRLPDTHTDEAYMSLEFVISKQIWANGYVSSIPEYGPNANKNSLILVTEIVISPSVSLKARYSAPSCAMPYTLHQQGTRHAYIAARAIPPMSFLLMEFPCQAWDLIQLFDITASAFFS